MSAARDPQSESRSKDPLATDDRRRTERRETNARLVVVIETAQFNGQADNLSEHGVFFFSPEKISVQVHVDMDGVQKRYRGRIVRVQQMNERESGFAIEFDKR